MDEEQIMLMYLFVRQLHFRRVIMSVVVLVSVYIMLYKHYEKHVLKTHIRARDEARMNNLNSIIRHSDVVCHSELQMDRRTFHILCQLLRTHERLKSKGLVSVEEQVCSFLHILAHHVKNRTIGSMFKRSGETVSRYFNSVLSAVLRLQGILLKVPEPILENYTDQRWKYFKNCLGALDGTYIDIHVASVDRPRYRTRKGDVATNVLGVCDRNMEFIFVFPGWEGSASDSRVLRDAISRPNGLKVPTGNYFLVDGGYTNGEGFLEPYRGTRYHLSTWENPPVNAQEYFNMRHASARNVIERCFGLLKMRWSILRSPCFYPIKTQCRIITACCLIHNLIRREMAFDPVERELEILVNDQGMQNVQNVEEPDIIGSVEQSEQWTMFGDNLATQLFNEWTTRGH